MRHLILILILAVAGYAVLYAAGPEHRRAAFSAARRHALRLLAVVITLFLLFFLAVQQPSLQLF